MSVLKFLMLVIASLSSSTLSVHGNSSGAPSKACQSLTPGHWWNVTTPIEPRKDNPPYFLSVDKYEVGQGEDMKGKGQEPNLLLFEI